jgi:hypothetical protein
MFCYTGLILMKYYMIPKKKVDLQIKYEPWFMDTTKIAFLVRNCWQQMFKSTEIRKQSPLLPEF